MKKLDLFHDYGTIDKQIIIEYAHSLGVHFPMTYIELLSKHNGLYPVQAYVKFVNFQGEEDIKCLSFFGYGYERIEVYDAESLALFQNSLGESDAIELSQPDEYSYQNVITIGNTAEGDYICFDYRENPTSSEPSIACMHHDQYVKDEQGNPKMAISKIANNFEEFIEMLHE